MPRIRSIKPEFWTSGQVLECSRNARLLFIGLWNFCDDEGRHPLRPKQIKAEVFPADELTPDDILGMIDELASNDLVILYEHDSQRFLKVKGWGHQRIDKPQPAKHPDPFDEHSQIIRGTIPPDRKRSDTKGGDQSLSGKPDLAANVFEHWQQVMGHQKAKLDDKRRKKINQRLKDGYSPDDLKRAIDGCKKSPHHMGDNERNTVYDGLELICRDAEHVDKFIAMAEGRGLKPQPQESRPPSQKNLN